MYVQTGLTAYFLAGQARLRCSMAGRRPPSVPKGTHVGQRGRSEGIPGRSGQVGTALNALECVVSTTPNNVSSGMAEVANRTSWRSKVPGTQEPHRSRWSPRVLMCLDASMSAGRPARLGGAGCWRRGWAGSRCGRAGCVPGQWMSSRRNASMAAARAHRPVVIRTA